MTTEQEKKHGFPCHKCKAETFDQAGDLCTGEPSCCGDEMSHEVFDESSRSPGCYLPAPYCYIEIDADTEISVHDEDGPKRVAVWTKHQVEAEAQKGK